MCLLVIWQVITQNHACQSPTPQNHSLVPGHCCLEQVAFVMTVSLKAKGARAKDFPSCFTFLLCLGTCFSLVELFHQSETPCIIVKQIPLQIIMDKAQCFVESWFKRFF